ncbi:MAG: hypothetical protein HYV19_13525 [Gemmatimonadetes bacterium]|nr:hypothetical protein [Gemmatimonadota bacterium]
MNGPEVLVPIAFFAMVVVLVLGVPLVRARIKERERRLMGMLPDGQSAERLARIEAAVESIAVEVERISEAQRFTTKLLAERSASPHPEERAR